MRLTREERKIIIAKFKEYKENAEEVNIDSDEGLINYFDPEDDETRVELMEVDFTTGDITVADVINIMEEKFLGRVIDKALLNEVEESLIVSNGNSIRFEDNRLIQIMY